MESKKIKILIVDDEQEIVSTLKQCLLVRGYLAKGALNGNEALNILEEEPADLILLDIVMPSLKGTEVARIVKEKYPAIKIIVITGYADEAEELSKEEILDALFIKPVELKRLYAAIATVEEKIKKELKTTVLLFKTRILLAMRDNLEQDYVYN